MEGFGGWLTTPVPRTGRDDLGQVLRLRRFREKHPRVIIGDGGFGTWLTNGGACACVPSMCPRSACYSGAGHRGGGRVSRPVGRVLCARSRGAADIHLGLPLPAASCGLPASIGRAALYRSRREPWLPS